MNKCSKEKKEREECNLSHFDFIIVFDMQQNQNNPVWLSKQKYLRKLFDFQLNVNAWKRLIELVSPFLLLALTFFLKINKINNKENFAPRKGI